MNGWRSLAGIGFFFRLVEPVEKPPTTFFIVLRLHEIILVEINRVRICVGARFFTVFMPICRIN